MLRALLVVLIACSPAAMPVSQDSKDPSNPSAPEGAALSAPSAAPTTAGAAEYVCPMHPEVTSSAPGKCPKCGMSLGPKK